MKKRTISFQSREELYGFLFISPWLIGLIFIFLIPLILSVLFSFSKIVFEPDGYDMVLVGLSNYKYALFEDAKYPKLLFDSFLGLLYNVPIILVFSFFVALLLKQKFPGCSGVKAIFFLPVILSSGLFVLLQSNFGQSTTNALEATMDSAASMISVLKSVNIKDYLLEMGIPVTWIGMITAPIDRMFAMILNSGVQIFIFLAGLNSISPSLYEAARVEGGTAWENFWKITFPMMTPLLLVNIIFSIVDSFTSVSNTVMEYVYKIAFSENNFGLSGAMSWIYFLILSLVMAVVVAGISKKIFYYT